MIAPWQRRAWSTVRWAWDVVVLCGMLTGSVPPRLPERVPAWVMEGAVTVSGRPLHVSGPDGEPWVVVRWSWRDVVIESVHTGPFAEREAAILQAILTQRMLGR